jgi:hypothetical protein
MARRSGSFQRLVLYVTMVSRDGPPFLGHVATATSTGIDKTSSQAPLRLGPLSSYKRAGQGSTTGTGDNGQQARHKIEINISRNHLVFLFLLLRPGLTTLSRKLVTPTQAPRCKEIQISPPPAERRAFSCPNQDKPPCVLLASPSRKGTRSTCSSV